MKANYISVNGSQIEIKIGLHTGQQIMRLAGLCDSTTLLLDNHGEIDVPINPTDLIILHGGEKFVTDDSPTVPPNPCYQKPIDFEINCKAHTGDEGFRQAKVTGREILETEPDIDVGDQLYIDIEGAADELLGPDQVLIVHRPLNFTSAPCGNVGEHAAIPPILSSHFTEVLERYPAARLETTPSGHVLIIEHYKLPDHWSEREVTIIVQVPQGYPSSPLDMFYVHPHITLADGRTPKQAEHRVTLLEMAWQRFSWHYQSRQWNVNADSLLSHLRFCNTRLASNH